MNDTLWKSLFVMVGFSIGALLTCQAGINSHLKTHLSYPIQAAFISFLTGTMVLLILCSGLGLYNYFQLGGAMDGGTGGSWFQKGIGQVPWWAWAGGFIGAFNVSCAILLVPRLGAVLLALTMVAGQILTAVALDHFGVLGYQKIPLTANRAIGAVLVIVGIVIVQWPFSSSGPPAQITPPAADADDAVSRQSSPTQPQ